jgi:hypothetical protein
MFRRFALTGFFAVLPALAGCMHFDHKSPDEPAWRPADTVPEESKSCVFIFLVDPIDPLASADLNGVCEYIQKLGFGKTFHGRSCHASYFAEKMHSIHEHCASAKLVVITYGAAADTVRKLTRSMSDSGVPVDVAIYLAPSGTESDAAISSHTVTAEELTNSNEVHDDEKPHSVRNGEVPMHSKTLSLIERELTLLGLSVPPPPRPESLKVSLIPPVPAPRETLAKPKPLPDDWQFLRLKNPWEQQPPTLPNLTEPLPLPKVVPELPAPKAKS